MEGLACFDGDLGYTAEMLKSRYIFFKHNESNVLGYCIKKHNWVGSEEIFA